MPLILQEKNNSLSKYIEEISKIPMLTEEEEYNYALLKENGDLNAAKILINSHLRLVVKIAMKYKNYGLSITDLIAEGNMLPSGYETLADASMTLRDTVVGHLDKSHVTVHTYPEYHPDTCIATFRVDIDVATCGEITPLSTLDYLIGSFDSDIITIDYRVRGFTRDMCGKKHFIDHNITSIQDYIDKTTLTKYDSNWNVVLENTNPFEGYELEVNHIGDIDIYNNELYLGVEYFSGVNVEGFYKRVQNLKFWIASIILYIEYRTYIYICSFKSIIYCIL